MKNNLTTFYIVRHGQTEWNVLRKLQGQTDIPLNSTGEQQARDIAKLLDHIHFDQVFSSDLLRAKRTAEIIALEKKLAVQITKALRERHFGTYEGMHADEFFSMFKNWQLLTEEEFDKQKPAEVESNVEVNKRFITFLREIAVGFPGQSILIVCHTGPIRRFLVNIGFVSSEKKILLENCSYIQVESNGVDFFLKETYGISEKNTDKEQNNYG